MRHTITIIRSLTPLAVLTSAITLGCGPSPQAPDAAGGASDAPAVPDAAAPLGPCDVLDPDECLLPWPSSHFLVGEGGTRRVAIPREAMPVNVAGASIDPAPWNRLDGFSPMTSMLARVQGAVDPSELPGWRDPAASLAATSPTVLYDATTGTRLAHFAEIEPSSDDPSHTVIYVRPAARLPESHHIVVALRDLHDTSGASIVPHAGFHALRDAAVDAPAAVLARRESFERDVLAPLSDAGVERDSLVLAWDFWTASGGALTADLVAMRDRAFDALGAPACTVTTSIETGLDPRIRRRVVGTFTAPSFVDAGGHLARDAAGAPEVAGTREVPFVALVPASATGATAGSVPALLYGHGLFNDANEVDQGYVHDLLAVDPMVAFGVDLSGLASPDIVTVAPILGDDLSGFDAAADRILDGVVGQLVFPRALAACAALPELAVDGAAVIDADDVRYYGISQGAIVGPTLAALSPDLERFVLDGGGVSYPIMMPRSTDWPTLESVLSGAYPSPLTRQLAMVMFAVHWDRFEGATFAPHVADSPFLDAGVPARRILYQVGLEDDGTPIVSAEIAARTMGLGVIAGSASTPYGLVSAAAGATRGYMAFDYGVPPLPDGPVAPPVNCVHESIRRDPAAQEQLLTFLRDGTLAAPAACAGACTSRPLHTCR